MTDDFLIAVSQSTHPLVVWVAVPKNTVATGRQAKALALRAAPAGASARILGTVRGGVDMGCPAHGGAFCAVPVPS